MHSKVSRNGWIIRPWLKRHGLRSPQDALVFAGETPCSKRFAAYRDPRAKRQPIHSLDAGRSSFKGFESLNVRQAIAGSYAVE